MSTQPYFDGLGRADRTVLRCEELAESKHWNEYNSAYETVLARCSTQPAPWFIVPADRKWYRNAVVARIVRSTLEALDLTYPAEIPGLDKVQIE